MPEDDDVVVTDVDQPVEMAEPEELEFVVDDGVPAPDPEKDRLRADIYVLRDYLRRENLPCSVAHATYSVNGKQLVWLDNAATTQKPQAVIDAVDEVLREL